MRRYEDVDKYIGLALEGEKGGMGLEGVMFS
jgi:hypothetical protein